MSVWVREPNIFEKLSVLSISKSMAILEKLLANNTVVRVYLATESGVSGTYLVVEFDNGSKAYFSDGEYGEVPLHGIVAGDNK